MFQTQAFHKKLTIVVFVTAFFAASSPRAFGQAYPFGLPKVVVTTRNDVTPEQLKSVALQMAQRRWKQASLGEMIPACDSDGNLTAYLFVFRIDSRPFGTETSIRAGVREAARNMSEGPSPTQGRRVLDPSKAHRSEKWYPGRPVPAALPPSTDPVAVGSDTRRGPWENQRYGIGTYGTVVVSAMKSRVPVPQVIHGLPPYYTHLEEAADRHKDRLGTGVRINRLIYVSPAEEYFELEGSGGKIFVDAHSLKAAVPPSVTHRSALGAPLPADEREKRDQLISSEWEKYGVH